MAWAEIPDEYMIVVIYRENRVVYVLNGGMFAGRVSSCYALNRSVIRGNELIILV